MFAALGDAPTFLIHDIKFHRAVANASHNPILASLIEMVSAMFYERRKRNVGAPRDLREAAEMHRLIYNALRDRNAEAAQLAMSEHLRQSQLVNIEELHGGA
jgi:GntR family transcriptional repressor for pyruvate dehydrogenase complex